MQMHCPGVHDEECCVWVVTRGQARKEVLHPVTEDGGGQKLVVDVNNKTEEVGKSSRGPPGEERRQGKRQLRMENPVNLAEGMCMQKHPGMLAGWITLG